MCIQHVMGLIFASGHSSILFLSFRSKVKNNYYIDNLSDVLNSSSLTEALVCMQICAKMFEFSQGIALHSTIISINFIS